MIPKRRRAPKMGTRAETRIRCAGHLKWIRGHECAVSKCYFAGKLRIEACHVRSGTDGSLGKKPGDNWTIPLCAAHHRMQHELGEPEFELLYGVKMKETAEALWAKSPHRKKWEEKLYSEMGE